MKKSSIKIQFLKQTDQTVVKLTMIPLALDTAILRTRYNIVDATILRFLSATSVSGVDDRP